MRSLSQKSFLWPWTWPERIRAMFREPKLPHEAINAIETMAGEGMNARQIARILNMQPRIVQRVIDRYRMRQAALRRRRKGKQK
ncbi:MAG: hypothetical protein D6820_00240 [Lentisphaerae bacterium]|nr:MAG: hypothetical protein D6820_00240 [Lentisphaerota bacterium]